MSRGNRRDKIFPDDVDRQDFLKTLAETCQKTGFQVHAYCLMPHHFHLVVETPEANLVAGLAWLLNTKGANRNLHRWMKNQPEGIFHSHSPPKEPEGEQA